MGRSTDCLICGGFSLHRNVFAKKHPQHVEGGMTITIITHMRTFELPRLQNPQRTITILHLYKYNHSLTYSSTYTKPICLWSLHMHLYLYIHSIIFLFSSQNKHLVPNTTFPVIKGTYKDSLQARYRRLFY